MPFWHSSGCLGFSETGGDGTVLVEFTWLDYQALWVATAGFGQPALVWRRPGVSGAVKQFAATAEEQFPVPHDSSHTMF